VQDSEESRTKRHVNAISINVRHHSSTFADFSVMTDAKLRKINDKVTAKQKIFYEIDCFPTIFCNFTAVNGDSLRRTVSAELGGGRNSPRLKAPAKLGGGTIRHGEKV